MIWLGERRGYATDWTTQLWVRATGKTLSLTEYPWLSGPVGDTRRIGGECFRQLAEREGLTLEKAPPRGILPDFSVLESRGFPVSRVSPAVRRFYERTAEYELDAWSEWCGAFRPFGWLLATLFSRRLQQLNVPLSGLDTSRGLTNEVWHLREPSTRATRYVVWVRELVDSGTTVYAGSYGICQLPSWPGPCLKVAFPLPNGNALVIMKPEVSDDGSVTLVSSGGGFGEPGFYFTVTSDDGKVTVRYLKAMRESIRVYEASNGEARADHRLRLFGLVFLRLHYRLRPVGS